jgi:hypothetical protein
VLGGVDEGQGRALGALAEDAARVFDGGLRVLFGLPDAAAQQFAQCREIGRVGGDDGIDLLQAAEATGLAFALRGSFDKVATKVFLLAPADVDVSAEERRRIAEAGFYSYQ